MSCFRMANRCGNRYILLSYTKVYSVIYDSGSFFRRAIFSPHETSPEVVAKGSSTAPTLSLSWAETLLGRRQEVPACAVVLLPVPHNGDFRRNAGPPRIEFLVSGPCYGAKRRGGSSRRQLLSVYGLSIICTTQWPLSEKTRTPSYA